MPIHWQSAAAGGRGGLHGWQFIQALASPGEVVDRVEIKAIKRRFLALNHDRIERTRLALREHQRDVLDLLPLFFHVNHPLLPGFVSKEVPCGIADYAPGKTALEAAIRLSKAFEYKRRPLPRYDISAVFLMGSSGTIAYSDKSDFDVWLCHHPSLDAGQLQVLAEKARAIETWALGVGIEIHIYIMDPQRFRSGELAELSSESSGSAQHHLLLDEFYRTSLLLAGCYPLWWLVPPQEEENYDIVAHKLKHQRFIKEGECIDFGGLASIPVEEFFGAALWQLFKAIDSPYKSVLKLMLMEAYAKERADGDLLSQRYKRAVYAGKNDLTELDPYVMLFNKLAEHLKRYGDEARFDLLRRCFYFKVNLKISQYDKLRNRNWRWHYMAEMTAAWGWRKEYINILDSRDHWKIHRVADERKILVDELTRCYRFLSDFVRHNESLSAINQGDINLLGRKLFSAFERKTGKVEIINHGISGNLWESRLSLHCGISSAGYEMWALYPGTVDAAQAADMAPLRAGAHALELVVWAYFNRVLDHHSGVAVYANAKRLTARELQAVIECLHSVYGDQPVYQGGTEVYTKNAYITNAIAIINMGIDPMEVISGEGRQLMTNRTDALCYSGMHYNLVNAIDMMITTSWGEVLTFHYSGANAVIDCLCEYFRLSGADPQTAATPFLARSYSSARGMMIGLRIESLFKDVTHCFYGYADKAERRYIVAIANVYYGLYLQDKVLASQRIGSHADLIGYLSLPRTEFCATAIDGYTLQETVLPLLYRHNHQDEIQLFYYMDGEEADVYVLDEVGALFYQRVSYSSGQFLLTHFAHLFDSLYLRSQSHQASSDFALPVSYYEITGSSGQSWRLLRRRLVRQPGLHRTQASLQVIGDLLEDGELELKVFCNNNEFSSLVLGEGLYDAVASHIASMRRSNTRYPIYITDLDMPAAVLLASSRARVTTNHYLQYKKQLEERFNAALQNAHLKTLSSSA